MASTDNNLFTDSTAVQLWLNRALSQDPERWIDQAEAGIAAVGVGPQSGIAPLAALETLRLPLIEALRAHAREASGRALPLDEIQSGGLLKALRIIGALRDAYARLIESMPDVPQASPTREPQVDRRGREVPPPPDVLAVFGPQQRSVSPRVIAVQRAIVAQMQAMLWCLRARVDLPARDWDLLVRLAKLARQHAAVDAPVSDPAYPEIMLTPRAAAATVAFVALADPRALTLAEYEVARDLALRNAHKIKLRVDSGDTAADASVWPSVRATAVETFRLDTRPMLDAIKRYTAELGAGMAPASLGLTRRLTSSVLVTVLNRLADRWRTPAAPPAVWRKPIAPQAMVVPTLHRMLGALNKGGRQAGGALVDRGASVYQYRRHDVDRVAAVGGADSARRQLDLVFAAAELWQIDGENATGLQCRRDAAMPRLNHDHLVAVRFGDAARVPPLFAVVEAVAQTMPESGVVAGQTLRLRLLRGVPTVVSIKLDGNTLEDAFLLVPPGAADDASLALVLPVGRWREGSETEFVHDGRARRIRLGKLLFRGLDFDQASFTELG
ncbi:hypothetical protein [Derxia gummosa]|uniref:Uncharacterized protein n=1 Tax=Derxia gummosa DSM 723 TaxID=1121388 RepID=A0A8B6X2D0_9BURK|nr:hypothetical protein [Derxia gummosa]